MLIKKCQTIVALLVVVMYIRKAVGFRFTVSQQIRIKGEDGYVAAVDQKDWEPTKYTWICSEHFITGTKSNDRLAPNYAPSIFKDEAERMERLMEEEEKKHLEEIERQKCIAEMDKIRIDQLKRVKELEKQHAIENVKQLEELKAANKALVEHITKSFSYSAVMQNNDFQKSTRRKTS